MNAGLTSNSRARVTLELEIAIIDNWGPSATVDEIHKQACESARQALIDVLRGGRARIVGHPKVTMVMVDAQDKY